MEKEVKAALATEHARRRGVVFFLPDVDVVCDCLPLRGRKSAWRLSLGPLGVVTV